MDVSSNSETLQNLFLDTLRAGKMPVAIYLSNGIKLQGIIVSYDNFVIFLKGSLSQMVYKHSISTIVPSKEIVFN